MGWDYVSELRPQTGLLFIPQVIYEHQEPWYVQKKTNNSSSRVLCQSYQQIHLVAKQEKLGEGSYEFCLSHFEGFFNVI
jgi:hypothetical protein